MAGKSKSFFDNGDEAFVRINKYLADAGICSRREADELVEKGRVFVDGVRAENGTKVAKGSRVTVDGKDITPEEKLVLIALNKPRGVVCTTDRRDPDNVIDFLNYKSRIFPIGRLDKDSEGLLLLTNDGDIVNKILRAGNNHEKEYIVTVNRQITDDFVKGMSGGVPILDTVTRPCFVEALSKNEFRIILTQGLNRQIRRMCEYFGYSVTSLVRVRIMNIRLGRLKSGGFRNVTPEELEELKRLIKDSRSVAAGRTEDKQGNKNGSDKQQPDKRTKTGRTYRPSRQGGKGVRAGKPRNNK